MGKTPLMKPRQPSHRNNPNANNYLDTVMPFVVLQRFESQKDSRGRAIRGTSNGYNREDNFTNPQSHHHATSSSFPRQQQYLAPIGPDSQYRGMIGSNNFYGKHTPRQQFRPQPSPHHQSGRGGGWHQQPAPMFDRPFASQRPPFNHKQWVPPTRNVRGRRQQTPMKRGTANMAFSVATNQTTAKPNHTISKTATVKASGKSTEWKRSPVKLRSLASNPVETGMKMSTSTSALAVDKQMKITQANEEDIPLAERRKSLINKRKSIESSVKRLSMPRNPKNAILSVVDKAKVEPQEEKVGRRKSTVTKRKSIEMTSTNKLSVHKVSTLDTATQSSNIVDSDKKINLKLSDQKRKSLIMKRKSLETASTKRLSMPRNAVLQAATQNKVGSAKEKQKSIVSKRRSVEAASTKRLSMPRNTVLRAAAQVKNSDAAKNEEMRKPPINKRRTLDSATIKKLSLPAQNSRRLSSNLNKRKSLISAGSCSIVQKVDTKKQNAPVATSSKVLISHTKEALKKVEKPKVTAECISPMYYTPETSPQNLPSTRSKSYPRSLSIMSENKQTKSKGKTPQPDNTDKKQSKDLMTRLNSRRSVSRTRIISNSLSQKSDEVNEVNSTEKYTKNKGSNNRSSNTRNIRTRSQSRAQSVGKMQITDMKRKRSVSEAPSSPPTPKKTKTTPTQANKSNVTPSALKRSGSMYTPSRRQLLGSPQSTVGTPRSRKSQPTTPQHNNRAAQMVLAVLNQQQEKQASAPKLLPTDVRRVGHSIDVQTVDPTDLLSDYDRLNPCNDSSSDEEETSHTKDKFMKQVDGFKQTLKGIYLYIAYKQRNQLIAYIV